MLGAIIHAKGAVFVMPENTAVPCLMGPPYLTPEEVRLRHRTSREVLAQQRYRGVGAPYVKLGGRRVLYPLRALQAWEAEQAGGAQ